MTTGFQTAYKRGARRLARMSDSALCALLASHRNGVRPAAEALRVAPIRLRQEIRDRGLPIVRDLAAGSLRRYGKAEFDRLTRGKTAGEAAKRLGCAILTVLREMRRRGIPRVPAVRRPVIAWDAKTLRRLYVEEGLTAEETGARLGVSQPAVLHWMRRFGIPLRPRGAKVRCGKGRYKREVDNRSRSCESV